ncbi:MAG: hypothetical protein ACRDUV_03465, partial [Pseudonocardiaceae bacterium]
MATTQPSGSGDRSGAEDTVRGEAPAPAQPEGFEHAQYEHDLPGSDVPVFGAIPSVVGTVLDVAQRARLAGGLTTRPAGNIPHTNADSYEHPELKRMIDDSKADQVHELGQMWNDLGNEI